MRCLMRMPYLLAWIIVFSLLGCREPKTTTAITGQQKPTASINGERIMSAYPKRPYWIHWRGGPVPSKPPAVVMVLHGGGSNMESARSMTCFAGDLTSQTCMEAVADKEGFVAVFPSGTGARFFENARTWNAGGGKNDWQCVSGDACKDSVDDIAYFKALLDDLPSVLRVDSKRVFASGLSNGAAMSHRLACQLSNRIAAVATVGGGNQFATSATCKPNRPIAVLSIHGTEDICWTLGGGGQGCFGGVGKKMVGITATVTDWASRNKCDMTAIITQLPDTDPNDGTTTTLENYPNCTLGTEVMLLRVQGGGHNWPGGYKYRPVLGKDAAGTVSQDYSASELIWMFFTRHSIA